MTLSLDALAFERPLLLHRSKPGTRNAHLDPTFLIVATHGPWDYSRVRRSGPGMPRCSAHRDQWAGHHPPVLDAANWLTPSSFRQGCVDHVDIYDRRRLGRFTVIQFEEDGSRAPHIIGG